MLSRQPSTAAVSAGSRLKGQLQWLLFLRILFLSLLLGVSALLQAKDHSLPIPPLHYLAYFIAGVYLFTIASALFLKRTDRYLKFTYVQLITDVLLVSCLVFFSGVSQSMFTIIYFFPIIAGGFLLFRAGGLLMAALCTICYGALLLFEYINPAAPSFAHFKISLVEPETLLHYFAINGLSFFLVALLSSALTERLHKTETALSLTVSNYDRLAQLYKQIFDDIGTGIITIDGSGLITSFNRASETITGYKAEEVIGVPVAQRFPGLRPTRQTDMRPLTQLTRKDGETIPVGYSWAKLHSPDGCENCRVFTMQNLSQIKKMEAQVRQAEKMAAIGEMAAGLAHEFRNPLAAILGSAQLLSRQLSRQIANQPTSRKLMEIILREGDRLETVLHEFLQFSRPAAPEKKWFSLPKLVEEALLDIRQTSVWSNNFQVVIDIPADLECWADPWQIKQVLVNLVNNSCQAMKNGSGNLAVAARRELNKESEKIMVRVSDSGPGVPANNLAKIFNPYFTTRKEGTGLGLAIVHQIVESHNGTVEATNDPAGGASFLVFLPLPPAP